MFHSPRRSSPMAGKRSIRVVSATHRTLFEAYLRCAISWTPCARAATSAGVRQRSRRPIAMPSRATLISGSPGPRKDNGCARRWQNGHMKKLKHEAELFKAALLAGVRYAEGRKAVEFEATDSASDKALYIYRLLVHDKVIAPMPEDQVSEKTIRHRLATWYARQLPDGHPLLG